MYILDLIQEGNIGLMIVADRIDITKGCKFSTYFDTVSINTLIVNDGDLVLEDFIFSCEQTPEEKIMALSLQAKVRELLKK